MSRIQAYAASLVLGFTAFTTHAYAVTCDSEPGDVVAVDAEYQLRSAPDKKAGKIKNEKASAATGSTEYHSVDNSVTVRRLCASGEWTEVQIVDPEWLSDVKGWLPTKTLRVMQFSASGKRVYVESDFDWKKDTAKYKSKIVPIVNKIFNERTGCDEINTFSIVREKSKSKEPHFSVMCNGKPGFAVSFKLSDGDKEFKDPVAVSKMAAIEACEKVAKSKAKHPSTVDFSKFMNASFKDFPDGSAVLRSKFTAKNALNLQLSYDIFCKFEENKLVESEITESN